MIEPDTIAQMRLEAESVRSVGQRIAVCYIDALLAHVKELQADAARYQWLKERYHGVDFDYDTAQPRISVLTFRIPDDIAVGANLDATIDIATERAT